MWVTWVPETNFGDLPSNREQQHNRCIKDDAIVKGAEAEKPLGQFARACQYFHIVLNIHSCLDSKPRLCRLLINAAIRKDTGVIIPAGLDLVEATKWKKTVT
jgi:hypothetical protein